MPTDEIWIRRERGPDRSLVIFVHGWTGDAGHTFGLLPAFLCGDLSLSEWDVLSFDYPSSLIPGLRGWKSNPDLRSLAGYLVQKLDGDYKNYERIAIVAHSMGGLVAQRALLDMTQPRRVSHVFLFGSPSAGLQKARFVSRLYRQVEDMRPDSDFVDGIKSGIGRLIDRRHVCVVAGLQDDFVPESSSLSVFPEEFHRRVPGDHLSMVKPPRADETTARLLLEGLAWAGAGSPAVDQATAVDQADESIDEGEDSDSQRVVNEALNLELRGEHEAAIRHLESFLTSSASLATAGRFYVSGALGGRHKRLAMMSTNSEKTRSHLGRALSAYNQGFVGARLASKWKPQVYNGINQACVQLMQGRKAAAIETAAEVSRVLDEHSDEASGYYHYHATRAEVQMYLDQAERAIASYRRQFALGSTAKRPMSPRLRRSTLEQAARVAALLDLEDLIDALEEMY